MRKEKEIKENEGREKVRDRDRQIESIRKVKENEAKTGRGMKESEKDKEINK
jgi:hypothetical protein